MLMNIAGKHVKRRNKKFLIIEEPDRIIGRARETRISIVQTVEVRLKFFFWLHHGIKKYNDVEDIKTHIFCSIEIFIQSTVLEKKIIY